MNERLKELAEQAGFIPGIMGLNRYTYFDPEKFAQLILAEMYIFMCNSTDNHKPWPSFKKVKAHFGVEE